MLWCSYVGCIYIYNCYIFFLDWSFDHYVVSFFVSFHSLCLKVYFIWYEYCYSCFLLVSICMEYLFPALHFQSVCPLFWGGSSLVAQRVKHLSTIQEIQLQSLGWEDPLEKEMAIHSRTVAWKIPWTEEPGRLQSMGSQRVGHDWATSLSFFLSFFIRHIPISYFWVSTPVYSHSEVSHLHLNWDW